MLRKKCAGSSSRSSFRVSVVVVVVVVAVAVTSVEAHNYAGRFERDCLRRDGCRAFAKRSLQIIIVEYTKLGGAVFRRVCVTL